MRFLTCLVAVGLAAGTTGCIDVMAPGFGGTPYANSAFGNGFGASPFSMSPVAAMSPFAASPYAANPYAMSPYAASPYAMSPYAASPYGGYQQPQIINQTQYVPVPTAAPPVQQPRNFAHWERRHRDTNGNGIPDRREWRQRDSDGDGIPDWKERRQERRAGRNG